MVEGFDCVWLQQRPRHEIEVGHAAGALRHLAGDLWVPMDDLKDNSGLEWEKARLSRAGWFLDEDHTGWGHGRGSKRVVRRADFSASSNLFGVSGTGVLWDGLGVLVRGVTCQHLVFGRWRR